MVASCTVVQWLIRPLQPGFDAQTLHSFLVLFHLIKVVRLKILVEEEGGHRVDVGIRYPDGMSEATRTWEAFNAALKEVYEAFGIEK